MNQSYPGIRLSPAEMEQLKRLLANQENRDVGFEARPGILPENSDPGFMPRGGDGIAPALSSLPTVNTVPSEPIDYPTIKNDSPYGYQMKRGAATGAPVPYGATYGYSADSAPLDDLPGINVDPVERARMVTDTRGEANPMSPYEQATADLRAAVNSDVPGNRKMSVLYGGAEAAREAAKSGSLAYTLGAFGGGALGGVLNKRLYGEAKKKEAIDKAKEVYGTEATLEKQGRDVREQEADITYKEALPGIKTEEQQRREKLDVQRGMDQRRRAVASMINDLDEFDPDDPKNSQTVADLRELGLPVVTKKRGQQLAYKQDASTGAWYVLSGDKTTGQATSSAVSAPSGEGQLKTTSPQQTAAGEREKDRQSRERIAKWKIASSDSNARQSRKIQQDKLKLSQTTFAARYPGYGKQPLTKDYIIQKAKALHMLEVEVAAQAIRQGYTIED